MQKTQETQVRPLGQEDPLEKKMANHSSVFAWEIPWTGVWWTTVHRVARSWTQLSMHSSPLSIQLEITGQEDWRWRWNSMNIHSLSWGPFLLGRNQFHAWSILLIAHPFHTENLLATWGINIHLQPGVHLTWFYVSAGRWAVLKFQTSLETTTVIWETPSHPRPTELESWGCGGGVGRMGGVSNLCLKSPG